MIGFTTLEIISLKSHRTPKMLDDDDDDDNDDDDDDGGDDDDHHHHHRKYVSNIFWAFHMSACRRVGFL